MLRYCSISMKTTNKFCPFRFIPFCMTPSNLLLRTVFSIGPTQVERADIFCVLQSNGNNIYVLMNLVENKMSFKAQTAKRTSILTCNKTVCRA